MEVNKSNIIKNLPFKIKDVEPEHNNELIKLFRGEQIGFVRVGPKGYILRQKYREEASNIYNMPLSSTDVFVSGYPRSGTTWTQELVWMVANDLDYATSDIVPLLKRYTNLDFSIYMHPSMIKKYEEDNKNSEERLKFLKSFTQPGSQQMASLSSPRFVKTHLPISLLPPTLLDTAKMVYVARDPRDAVVSYYHLCRLWKLHGYIGDCKTYWNYFLKDLIIWTPYFEHLKEAWAQRDNPNLLFLFYEELRKDLPSAIQRVANFFNKQFTEEQVSRLCDHLSFQNFKTNNLLNNDLMKDFSLCTSGEEPFVRKGKVGGWRDYFDEEMTRQAERWMADNLRDTDLRFPHLEKQ